MRNVATAFRAALTAQGIARVYEQGKVPTSPTLPYVVVSASTPARGDINMADRTASARWRFVTLYVGTSETSALWLAEDVEAALLDKRLTVAGLNCSRMKREAGRPIAPDPNVEHLTSGADTWTFTATPSA
jgi:hypothetical protein